MSSPKSEDVKQQEVGDDGVKDPVDVNLAMEAVKESEKIVENPMLSPEQEEEAIRKKYGGILPKKKPLISKDHERAFFDSADWALGKQGAQKPKGPLEALRPKLEPTPHQQARSRRSAYAPADDDNVDGGNDHASPEEENCTLDGGNDNNAAVESPQSLHG